jgi:hypothetical protein
VAAFARADGLIIRFDGIAPGIAGDNLMNTV